MLAHNPPAYLLFQDSRSVELLERPEEEASALDETLEEIDAHSFEETGSKINLCEFALPEYDIEEIRCIMQGLRFARQRAQEIGLRAARGREPLHLFYEFVRQLHKLYAAPAEKVSAKRRTRRQKVTSSTWCLRRRQCCPQLSGATA